MFNNAVDIPGSNPIFNNTTQGTILNIYQSPGSNPGPKRLHSFDSLLECVSTGALHNSGEVSDAPKCHPGTRVAIIDRLFQWASASVYQVCIQWLFGSAGAGKSAILRTLAALLEQHGLLLASFFFFRAAANRNTTDRFIPTITYQISTSIPTTRRYIDQAIKNDPLILSRSLAAQAQALIVVPITKAHKEGSIEGQYPRIIIVDGLDECQGVEKQQQLLQVLNDTLLKLPIPFAILIASRPEPHIRDTFNSDLNKTSTRLELDDSYKPDKDIQKFFDDKFHDICKRHPLRSHLPKPWPPPSVITTLVAKASGQFILPSTVIRFVEPHRHDPSKRLAMVMGSISPGKLRPFQQLDDLYSIIFSFIDPDQLDTALAILGVLLVPYRGSADIRQLPLLGLIAGYTQVEIIQSLFDLESLLQIKDHGPLSTNTIRIYHASLADFLFDQHRSGRFFVAPSMIYEHLARRSIETLIFSDAYLALPFLKYNFHDFICKAEPTKKLVETMKGCTTTKLALLGGKGSFMTTLGILCERITPRILGPRPLLTSGIDIFHANLLATLHEVVAARVEFYFDANLTPLLVCVVEISSNAAFWYQGYSKCCILPKLVEIINQEQQNGFCITRTWSAVSVEQTSKGFYDLLIKIIGNRLGDCYADFAIHSLNWLNSELPIISNEVKLHGEVASSQVESTANNFLSQVLEKSCPRPDVRQLLLDNPLPPVLEEDLGDYAAAVQSYLLKSS